MKKGWLRQLYGLTLSYEINSDEMRHTNWGSMTGADLRVYSMHESSGSRLNLSILYDVLSWMIDVVNWLLCVKWCILVIIWDILNMSLPFLVCGMCLFLLSCLWCVFVSTAMIMLYTRAGNVANALEWVGCSFKKFFFFEKILFCLYVYM